MHGDAERELALESLRRYQMLFERGSLGQLGVDLGSGRIEAVNTALCRMTGYTSEALLGRRVALIFPPNRDPLAETIARLGDGTTDAYSVERCLQRRDGSTLPVLSMVSAVRDDNGVARHVVVLIQDLTEQRAAEDAQRRSQALVEAALAALPVTLTTFDVELRFTSVQGGLDQVGNEPGDFLARHISEVTTEPATIEAMERAVDGITSTTRTVVNGQTYLTVYGPLCDEAQAVVGVVAASTNVTLEVAAEAQSRRADELSLFTAQHDPLTGLPGRAMLVGHLNTRTPSAPGVGALLLLDLDDFTLINDSLGHEVGDAVLVDVASRLRDAFPGWMVSRQGGDEFALAPPPDVVEGAAPESLAARVSDALAAEVEVGTHRVRVTASVGVAIELSNGSPSTLMRNADSALSHAKQAGTGQYRLYDAEMRRVAKDRQRIQRGLQDALAAGQLRVAYQPIVRLADRRTLGAEALVRWLHPEWGMVSPQDFIPIAESSGLIVPVGRWVMDVACRDLLAVKGRADLYIAVNVSARQLAGGGFAGWVEEVLAESGLHPCALTVEVTESALMDEVGPISAAFERLRSLGVSVAIDDFGTGYSSLARLQRLPVDVIKLDREFVTRIDRRAPARGMASAILQMSAAIGACVIAEGVETEPEAATLVDLGYTMAQGFLFARPMPIADLGARLRDELGPRP
jgi:diguanylate cyclase (GGDEF)-like protein/PAS domain S-box-containing protein